MNELEYRNKMLAIRMAELAVLQRISDNVAHMATTGGKSPAAMDIKKALDLYDLAKRLTDKLPPG